MNDVNKIISNFKKGVADALFRGKENNPNNLDYYRQGYDYGIFLFYFLIVAVPWRLELGAWSLRLLTY